jgi:hypothetical protein
MEEDMKKTDNQAKNFLFIRNTALQICDKEEENRFNKILKSENDECFTPDLDEYDSPYPYYVISLDMCGMKNLIHTNIVHDEKKMGALDMCSSMIDIEELEKELMI